MQEVHTTINAGGRIVIPAAYRKEMGLKEGDSVRLHLSDGELKVISKKQAIKRAQELVAKYAKDTPSLVDVLFEMRREEFRKEEEGL